MKGKKKKATELVLEDHLRELGLEFEREYRFHTERRWRFDYFVRNFSRSAAIEIEGGAWIPGGGGHNRGQAFIDDMEKYNHAAALGYKVLRFTPQQINSGYAKEFLKEWVL